MRLCSSSPSGRSSVVLPLGISSNRQRLIHPQPMGDCFTPQPQPKFQGKKFTQLLNEGFLLRAPQMREAMALDEDAYYGEVPEALIKATGYSDAQIKSGLEELVLTLQREKPQQQTFLLPSGKTLQVELAGEGTDARVYRLTMGDLSYALKVFFTPGTGSALQETANGAFFNAHNTRDVSQLYVSNPVKRWTLMEFIGKDTKLSGRSGQSRKQQQFATDDEMHGPNTIRGILVDHGGVMDVPERWRMTDDLFKQKLVEAGLLVSEKSQTENSVSSPKPIRVTI